MAKYCPIKLSRHTAAMHRYRLAHAAAAWTALCLKQHVRPALHHPVQSRAGNGLQCWHGSGTSSSS